MAFEILNEAASVVYVLAGENRYPQAEPDKVDFDILAQGENGEGVVSGCLVTERALGQNATVDVAAGTVYIGGTDVAYVGGNVNCGAAHAALPRFDLIIVDNLGACTAVNGVAAVVPEFPAAAAVPATSVVIAAVWRAANDNTIADADIVDKRCIIVVHGVPDRDLAATSPASFTSWASKAGTRRKILVWDEVDRPVWDWLNPWDVLTPARIASMFIRTAGAYPDGQTYKALVANAGVDTPQFLLSYEPNTPTALSIDILGHTYGGGRNPEVAPGDYPDAVWADFARAWEASAAINRGQAVAESVTFRATATVGGVAGVTRDVTLVYQNERMWGESVNPAINTQAEILAFHGAQNKELSTISAKTFAVNLAAGEYGIYIVRTALGVVATDFFINPPGPPGGWIRSDGGVPTAWTNVRGFVENYDCWRTTNPALGAITVQVL